MDPKQILMHAMNAAKEIHKTLPIMEAVVKETTSKMSESELRTASPELNKCTSGLKEANKMFEKLNDLSAFQ